MSSAVEQIVTSPKGKEMLTYIPPLYEQSRVMAAIFQANGTTVDDMDAWTDDVRLQAFPQTATWALKYWEMSVGIPVDETKTYELRRPPVIARLRATRGRIGVNEEKIRMIAQVYAGCEASIVRDYANYAFKIKYGGPHGIPPNMEDARKNIQNACPAHLTFDFIYNFFLVSNMGTLTIAALGQTKIGQYAPGPGGA